MFFEQLRIQGYVDCFRSSLLCGKPGVMGTARMTRMVMKLRLMARIMTTVRMGTRKMMMIKI